MARKIRLSRTTSSWVFLTIFWTVINLAASQTTTRAPNFQALYRHADGQTSTISCPFGQNFWTSGTFGGCCAPTLTESKSCGIPTQCHAGTVTDRFGRTRTCWLVYDCGNNWSAHTVFRDIQYTTCALASSIPSVDESKPSPASGVGGAVASSTETDVPTDSSSSSKAWIAGAVAGPVVALVAGALGFWFGTRRKHGAEAVDNNKHVDAVDGGETVMNGARSVQRSIQSQAICRPIEAPCQYHYPSPSPFQQQRLSGLFPVYAPPPPQPMLRPVTADSG
ncbi:hypothetical protein B0H65DRAFT_543130 [Neurospora tetraspora]|uniref:Uncharacterized protein n=1 Tax=Neurospora tetraspora TaxID=94610 RepID=A0AAE0J1X9_9PEZI|nr:hypothetical protein B0H65DRAFT_543130 [Neurospora tetraspora]